MAPAKRIRNINWMEDAKLKGDLLRYTSQNMKLDKVLAIVKVDFPQYSWSSQGLSRRRRHFNIKCISQEVSLSEIEAAVRSEISNSGSFDLGYRATAKRIREIHGLNVARDTVYEVMKRLNPDGFKRRKPNHLTTDNKSKQIKSSVSAPSMEYPCVSHILTQAKNFLVDFASSSTDIRGAVLLGSCAVNQTTASSDLDILFIIQEDIRITEYQSRLLDGIYSVTEPNKPSIFSDVESKLLMDDKTVVYIAGQSGRSLKLDIGHATDVMQKARFVVGSEIKQEHLAQAICLDYACEDGSSSPIGRIFTQLSELLSSADPYAEAGVSNTDVRTEAHSFVEIFDNCVSALERCDEYRVEFFLFILRHRLLALQLLSCDSREHVYLPKRAYDNPVIEQFTIGREPAPNILVGMLRLFKSFAEVERMTNFIAADDFKLWCVFLGKRLDGFSADARNS